MSDNPFDKLLEAAPSQNYGNRNPFDDVFEQENQERKEKLKQILNTVSTLDPDKTGEAQKLAERLNLPPGVALNSDDTIKILQERDKRQNINQMDLAASNPILMRHLTDPDFAAIAQDNVEQLGLIEGTFTGIQNFPENAAQGWEKGRLLTEMGKLGYQKKIGQSNEIIDARLEEINTRMQELEDDGSGMWENASEILGQWSATMPEAVKYGTAGAGTGGALGLAGGPFAKITVTGGALTGFVWGMTSGMAKESYVIESGHMYLDLINSGSSEETAKNVALGVGLVNAGLEFVGLSVVTAPIKKLLIKETTEQVTKALVKPSLKQVLKKTSTDAFNSWASEVGTEVIQELVNVAGEDFANYFDEGEFESKLTTAEGRTEISQRLSAVFEKVGTAMIPLAGLSAGPTFITNISKAKNATKESAFIESLTNLSTTDKTKTRNPNLFQNYVQNVANGKDVPNIFVDAEILNQQLRNNGITMEQLELFAPDIAKDLKDINGTGGQGDIAIKTGEYATKIAGTELGTSLQPHMRVTQDSMSATEAAQFASEREVLQQEAIQILQEQKLASQEFNRDATTVKNNVSNQLKSTGVYTPNQTKFLSTFVRDFAITQANKLGVKPSEFFSKYFYNITTEDAFIATPQQELFNQDGTVKTESPAFKKFFGKSKLVNQDGTPQIVYHGTADNIAKFNLNHPNRKDTGWLGTGVYLTDNENLAKYYADVKAMKKRQGRLPNDGVGSNILPLYVRLENPYTATLDEKQQIRTGGRGAADAFRDKLIAEGYDGVIMPVLDGQEIVVFDSKAVKSTFNSGTWYRETADLLKQQLAEQELFNQKSKQKRGKPIPDNILELGQLKNSFDFAGEKQYATNRDFKIALQERINNAAKEAGVKLSEFTVEVEKHLVQNLLADAGFALETNPNAVGWYNEKVTKALNILSLIHPEIDTNPQSRFAFTWALANTSNGLKVDKNFELAEQAYAYYAQNGVMPIDIGIGDASAAINNNMKLFNRLMEEKGFEEFEQFMKTMHTVKEVEAYTGSTVSGENLTEMVYGAAVMGPKIGNGFFANLYGQFEQLTMDRWLMRTWGRMTGTLITDYKKQAKTKREQLKPLIKGLSLKDKKTFEKIIGIKIKLSNLDQVAVAIQKASMKPANRKAMAKIATIENETNLELITQILGEPKKNIERIGIGDELRKGGNGLAKFLDGQKEAPSGPVERRQIRKVFSQTLSLLQQDEKSLTMADLQALVWYPEKRLYDSAKLNEVEQNTGYQDNEAPDYSNAAVNLAKQLGVSDTDIQTTLQEVDLELERQAIERTGRSESGEGTGGIVQRDNIKTDEATGLALNPDGTVTVFHHTNKRAADAIRKSSELRSAAEPDVYVTTRAIADTGYGDTAVAIRVEPSRLSLDDEFPNGRRDFRLNVGKPRGSIRVKVGEFAQDLATQSEIFSQQQIPGGTRGGFDPKTLTTVLTKEADFSTFLHETAHYMLTVMEDMAGQDIATDSVKNDFQILLDFFGVKDIDTWNKLSLQQKRKYHENFAYNYEIYLFENKAPNTKLQEIFSQFSKFLRRIYKSIRDELNVIYRKENGVDLPILTDEVRGVMDRMLASEEQITQAQEIYGMKAMFATQEQSGMDDATWQEYTAAIQ